ncbi:MAG TPA: ABC transporter permease subunit [Capsulimonadaceae bacterium]|jgi:ABC-type transport system involved in multi-copper enzyme maturation permease subunit
MLKVMRHIGAIAKVSMLEGARKQIFHVLMLFSITLLAVAIMLGRFGHDVQIQTIKDMCSAVILISTGLIAITLSVTGIQQELEQKTAYPVLAKPLARWEFVTGKYFGTMGTVAIGVVILGVTFCSVLLAYSGTIDVGVLLVLPFVLLEAAILGAIGTMLSTVASPPLAWFLSVFIYILGSAKFGIYSYLTGGKEANAFSKTLGTVIYHLLPNLECYNFKESLVHHLAVPTPYLIQTALYAVLYVASLLTVASLAFARKEL